MSLIYIDSCGDVYSSGEVALRFSSVSGTPPTVEVGGGRNTSNGLKMEASTTFFAKTVTGKDEYTAGIAFRLQTLTTPVTILDFNEGATNHIKIKVLANGAIEVLRDAASLDISVPGLVLPGAYSYMEVRVVIDDAAGIVTVHLDEIEITALTVQDTQNGGTGVIDSIQCNGTSDVIFFDDFYITDNVGAAPQNGFLGNMHITTAVAISDSTPLDITIIEPTAPTTHFDKVNQIPADGDTSFLASKTPGDQDMFNFSPLPILSGNGDVFGIQVNVFAKKDNEGPRQVKPIIDPGVAISVGAALELTTVYRFGISMFQQNPDTSLDWTEAEVDSSKVGFEVG